MSEEIDLSEYDALLTADDGDKHESPGDSEDVPQNGDDLDVDDDGEDDE